MTTFQKTLVLQLDKGGGDGVAGQTQLPGQGPAGGQAAAWGQSSFDDRFA